MSTVVCRLCNSESGTHMSSCPVLSKLSWSMGKAPDAEKIRLAEQLTEALARMSAAEHRLLDYEGKEMLYSGRTELAAFRKREPFVQDVLVKHDALTQCVLHGDGDCENEDAALFEALEKLRKWSPT